MLQKMAKRKCKPDPGEMRVKRRVDLSTDGNDSFKQLIDTHFVLNTPGDT